MSELINIQDSYIATSTFIPVSTELYVVPYKHINADDTYEIKYKKELFQVRYNPSSKLYSYHYFVEEITDPNKQRQSCNRKTFRRMKSTVQKAIIESYGALDVDEKKVYEQMNIFSN